MSRLISLAGVGAPFVVMGHSLGTAIATEFFASLQEQSPITRLNPRC